MSEPTWKPGRHRVLWRAEYRGWDLRIQPCNLGYQWIVSLAARELMRGPVEATVPAAKAAAIAAVDAKMQ